MRERGGLSHTLGRGSCRKREREDEEKEESTRQI